MSEGRLSVIGGLLVALGPISLSLYTPAMPELVRVFYTDVATIKLTLTTYFAGFAMSQLVCGPLSDAFGRRKTALGFTFIYLVASVVAASAPSVEWLLGARLVQGIGAAAGVSVARAMVRDLYTGEASVRILNMIGVLLAIGPAVSPTMGGIALDLFGWQSIFFFMVGYGAMLTIVLLTLTPETLAHPDLAAAPGAARLQLQAAYRQSGVSRPEHHLRLYGRRALYDGDAASFRHDRRSWADADALRLLDDHAVGLVSDRRDRDAAAPSPLRGASDGAFRHRDDGHRGRVARHRAAPCTAKLPERDGADCALRLRHRLHIAFHADGGARLFPDIAGSAAALMGFFQMGGGFLGSAVSAAIGRPVFSLATIIPAMIAFAVAAHYGLRALAGPQRMLDSVADRIVKPEAPAE